MRIDFERTAVVIRLFTITCNRSAEDKTVACYMPQDNPLRWSVHVVIAIAIGGHVHEVDFNNYEPTAYRHALVF